MTFLEANFCFILRLNTKLIASELIVKIQNEQIPELVGVWPPPVANGLREDEVSSQSGVEMTASISNGGTARPSRAATRLAAPAERWAGGIIMLVN